MSGHETIRVLEVGVDAPTPVENEGKTVETTAATRTAPVSCPSESSKTGNEGIEQNTEKAHGESGGKEYFVLEKILFLPFSPSTFCPRTD